MTASTPPLVVFITGCSEGGIGAALCREYASRGARVFAGLRNLANIGTLSAVPGVEAVQIDVVDDDSVQNAVQSIIKTAGHIDVLVNNAGVNAGAGASVEVPVERYRQTFETNLFGLIRVTQNVALHMIKRRKGCIVNLGSSAAFLHLPFSAAYSSSKAAVHSFNDALRLELAPLGVHVLCVAPGIIESSLGPNSMAHVTRPAKDSPFRSALPAIEYKPENEQPGVKTPAKELAKAICDTVELPTWRRRAYLTYGATASQAWVTYYLPPRIRDRALSRLFKLDTLGRGETLTSSVASHKQAV